MEFGAHHASIPAYGIGGIEHRHQQRENACENVYQQSQFGGVHASDVISQNNNYIMGHCGNMDIRPQVHQRSVNAIQSSQDFYPENDMFAGEARARAMPESSFEDITLLPRFPRGEVSTFSSHGVPTTMEPSFHDFQETNEQEQEFMQDTQQGSDETKDGIPAIIGEESSSSYEVEECLPMVMVNAEEYMDKEPQRSEDTDTTLLDAAEMLSRSLLRVLCRSDHMDPQLRKHKVKPENFLPFMYEHLAREVPPLHALLADSDAMTSTHDSQEDEDEDYGNNEQEEDSGSSGSSSDTESDTSQ